MARPLTVPVCLLLLGCVDSSTTPAEPVGETGPEAAAPGIAEDAPMPSAPTDAGAHQLVRPSTPDCTEVPIDLIRPVCAADHWCWSHPLPQGNSLTATVGFANAAGKTELWAVGFLGTILRLRDGVWEGISSGTTRHLSAIGGSAPDDLWAAGEQGTVLHYDGAVWSPVDVGDNVAFRAVWANGRRDVWIAGARGHVLHWDGSSWSRSPNPAAGNLNALWGVGNDTRVNETRVLYAVGDDGLQLKWDGAEWKLVPPLHPYSSYGVYGTAPNNVWTGGQWGMATHYDGAGWSTSSTRARVDIRAIASSGPDDVWAVGRSGLIAHFDGEQWQNDQVGGESESWGGAWACGPNSAWFVGASGTVRQWTFDQAYRIRNGAIIEPGLHGGSIVDVRGISGSGPNDVWAFTTTGVMHWDGSAWAFTSLWIWGRPMAILALSPNEVYVVTYDRTAKDGDPNARLLRWDGTTWSAPEQPRFSVVYGTETHLGGTGAGDLWLSGYDEKGWVPQVFHRKDGTWTLAFEGVSASRLWAPSKSELWAVSGSTLYRYRASGLTEFPTPDGIWLYDMWSPRSSPMSGAWAVGEGGAIARWNGAAWTLQPSVTTRTLRAVWGSSATDIWAAGDGVIVHYDGAAWSVFENVTANGLGGRPAGGLWGSSSNDVWVIGERGTILRRHLP